ncbi:MAG TPA: hypothetical protein VN150_09165 [Ochrobactrum sp.]|nr:hypothetical protein [Ochrobactrum sp.]
MDLNQLYTDHQISLIRAAGAASESARRKRLLAACIIGGHIFDLRSSKNATASAGRLPWAGQFGQTAEWCVSA